MNSVINLRIFGVQTAQLKNRNKRVLISQSRVKEGKNERESADVGTSPYSARSRSSASTGSPRGRRTSSASDSHSFHSSKPASERGRPSGAVLPRQEAERGQRVARLVGSGGGRHQRRILQPGTGFRRHPGTVRSPGKWPPQ